MQDLNYDFTRDYITDCWYSHLIKATHRSLLHVEDDIFELELLRVNDEFLMERFLDVGYEGTNLRILNHIRIHLHAITLADITTADGKRISTAAWNLKAGNNLCEKFNWPRTASTFPVLWKQLWQVALRQTFIQLSRNPNKRLLQFRLHEWYQSRGFAQW